MALRIFISRNLSNTSILRNLSSNQIEVQDESLIDIQEIPIIHSNESKPCVFFYSQNGIRIFFKNFPYQSQVMYGVMGPSSAALFKEITQAFPQFIGKGTSKEIAQELEIFAGPHPILFVKAKNSLSSVEKQLSESQKRDELIVYENVPKKEFDIPPCHVLVFTSPMNVQSYCEKYKHNGEHIIAIGSTTANEVKKFTDAQIDIAREPSENSLYAAIYDYIKNNYPDQLNIS